MGNLRASSFGFARSGSRSIRRRNLAVTRGVLLLIIAIAAALIRFSRRAQRLAELQMDFVAGVSHELRTPLTVIHTAAYNLRGRVAANPSRWSDTAPSSNRKAGASRNWWSRY